MSTLIVLEILLLFSTPAPGAGTVPGDTLREARIEGGRAVSARSAQGETIGAEELSRFNLLSDAVRFLGGVQLKDYGGTGGLKTVNVRSLGSEHTGVFIDGVKIENAQNMQVDLGRFSSGTFSSLTLGNNVPRRLCSAEEALSGASLFLESAEPVFRGGERAHYRLELRGGSFGTFSPEFTHEARLGKNTAIRSDLGLTHSNGRYRFHERKYIQTPEGSWAGYDTTMVRQNGDINSFRAESRLSGRTEASDWNVKAYFYDSERGLPGPVVRRAQGAISSADRQEDRNTFVQGGWTLRGGNGASLMVRGKYSFDYTRYRTDPAADPQAMPVDNRYRQQNLYLSAAGLRELGDDWSLNFAVDGRRSRLDADLMDFVYPRRNTLSGVFGTSWDKGPFSAAASVAGLLARDTFNGDRQRRQSGFSKENRTWDKLSPSLTFRWSPLKSSGPPDRPAGIATAAPAIWAFARQSYRLPSFNDLYYTIVGNTDLLPETAFQTGLGGSYSAAPSRSCSFALSAEVYHNNVKDKIVAVPTANQFRWSMFNIGKADIWGTEEKAAFGYRGRTLSLSLTLRHSYQNARNLTDPDFATWKGQIQYIPKHSGSATATLAVKGWELALNGLFNSRRWSSSANLPEYELPAWATADASLSKAIRFSSGAAPRELRMKLDVRNLSGTQYEIVSGYPMPGANVLASLEYSF